MLKLWKLDTLTRVFRGKTMMPGEIFRRQSNIERNFRLVIAKPIDATSLINILKSIQMTCKFYFKRWWSISDTARYPNCTMISRASWYFRSTNIRFDRGSKEFSNRGKKICKKNLEGNKNKKKYLRSQVFRSKSERWNFNRIVVCVM